MWVELPPIGIILLNVAAIPAIQLGCAWIFTKLPEGWFDAPLPSRPPPRSSSSLFLKKWKRHLPDGASWFAGGFHKRVLMSKDARYLSRFILETRRGEACHWTAMISCSIPFFWNPWWGCWVIGLYAVVANLPCILLQRVNRKRLQRMLLRRNHASSADAKSARS